MGFALLGTSVAASPRGARRIGAAVAAGSVVMGLAYALSLLGNDTFPTSGRVFGIVSLSGVSWLIAQWRYGSRSAVFFLAILVVLVLASLSRMALVATAVVVVLSRFRPRKRGAYLRLLVAACLGLLALYAAIMQFGPLRARFFQGDLSMTVGGITINAMGRTRMWRTTWASFLLSPWMGHGPGSAHYAINAVMPGLDHPHNEYLRLLHDYGIVGCALWVCGQLQLTRALWRTWLKADRLGSASAPVYLAGVLMLVGLGIAMFTDNPLAYFFVMAPLGGLVGVSLGLQTSMRSRTYSASRARRGPCGSAAQPRVDVDA